MLGRVEKEVTRGHWAGQRGHAALTCGREELGASLRRWFLDKQQPPLTEQKQGQHLRLARTL